MIKFDIENWVTGRIKFTAEIDCTENDPRSWKLRLAVEWAIRNEVDLTWANLTRANLTRADFTGADLTRANLTRANLTWANLTRADFTGADLTWANLTRANLTRANLTEADLTEANLTRANLTWANLTWANITVPSINNIHQQVHDAVKGGEALDMGVWHNDCRTEHCRAGWVVVLAGEDGLALEEKIGTSAAASAIYLKSDPTLTKIPDFHCSNSEAMEGIIRCAEKEKAHNEAIAND